MKKYYLILWLSFIAACSYSQKPGGFNALRYEDDFSAMRDSMPRGWYSKMKFTPLNESKSAYLSAGGELRYQYFYVSNEDWGDSPQDADGYLLSRGLLHLDVHLRKLRLFFQVQNSNASGRENPNTIESNPLDYHQVFAEWPFLESETNRLLLRAGRQELTFGSQRLIAAREIPNSRLAFDAARLQFKSRKLTTDLFFAYPVVNQAGIFDDHLNEDSQIWGSYTTVKKLPLVGNLDWYYLGLWKKDAVVDDANGQEIRHSVGARFWKSEGDFHYDFEGVYQFGTFDGKTINAWTLSSFTTYQFSRYRMKPTLGLKTEIISGDRHANDNHIETFNPLFPRGAYFGLAALIGPSNIVDLHPSVDFELTPNWTVNLDCDVFWRMSIRDGIYAPSTRLIYSGKQTNEKYIGAQYSFESTYRLSDMLTIKAECTWFDPGGFIKASGTGKDILFSGLTTQFKF